MMYPKTETKKKRKRHKKSILQEKNGVCYLCAALNRDNSRHNYLEEHHIFGGANRDKSEAEGLKVYLCLWHHQTGPCAVHRNAEVMDYLRAEGQKAFEKTHSREEFVKLIGKNYL